MPTQVPKNQTQNVEESVSPKPQNSQRSTKNNVERVAKRTLTNAPESVCSPTIHLFKNNQHGKLLEEFVAVFSKQVPVYICLTQAKNQINIGTTEEIISSLKLQNTAILWVIKPNGDLVLGLKPNAGHAPLKHSLLAIMNPNLVEQIETHTQNDLNYSKLLDSEQLFNHLTLKQATQVTSAGTLFIRKNLLNKKPELVITNESGHFMPSKKSLESIKNFAKNLIKQVNEKKQFDNIQIVFQTWEPGQAA